MGSDFGILSSLGIGSGVLTSNVIDKLKKADEEVMVKPLEDKLDLIKKRDKALTQFITIASTVKGDIVDLAEGTAFAKVSTNVSGSSVSVIANDGVKPQNFDINVESLAKNDIYESTGFASLDTQITSKDATIHIGVGGATVNLNLKAGTTLSELKDTINNANIGITAQIINTGIGDNPYKLILKADDTGKDNTIHFDYGEIDDLGLNQVVYKSATYSSDTDSVNNSGSDQTFKVSVNGTTYSMTVTNGESVSDFVNAINNGDLKDSNGNSLKGINASFTDGQIQIKLQHIGDISFDDTGLTTDINDNTDFTNAARIQTVADSVFDYNNVEIERSTNKITDLIPGVTINLQSTGDSNVEIKSNVDEIAKSIQQFVADYNAMITNVQSLTAFDKDSGNVGLFQGNSDFTMISPKLSSDIFDTMFDYTTTQKDLNGNSYEGKAIFSAADIGLSMNRTGLLSFDVDKFKQTYEKHPDLVERFATTAFTKMKNDFDSIATGNHSSLELLSQEIKNEEKSYEDRIKSMNKFLDTRYDIMAEQFASYDEMINRLNTMSNALNMAIQQEINSKK